MSTLMSFKTSGGDSGRCDSRCYDAKGPICNCCCMGMNHGVGLQKAHENTNRVGQEWMKKFNEEHPDHKLIIEKTLL